MGAKEDTEKAKAKQGGGQAAKDTAAAKAKQGGGQAAKDTAAAKAKQGGGQAAKDTAKAASRTSRDKGHSKGGSEAKGGSSMDQREAAAGLNLAGNDTMSGRGGEGQTFAEREAAAGLNLAGNDTMSGRGGSDPFYDYDGGRPSSDEATGENIHDSIDDSLPASNAGFAAIIIVNGLPFEGRVHGTIGRRMS